jgi:nitroreductase
LDAFEAIKGRRSVRAYTSEEVSEKEIEKLIEAARWAPSAGNIQPWEFVIVTKTETKRRLADAALHQTSIEEAPVIIVVCANVAQSSVGYGSRDANLYCLQDTAAATENMLLAATPLGLATCWVGAFHENEVAKVINTPKEVRPVAIIPVGHVAEKPTAPPKKSLREIVHYETF